MVPPYLLHSTVKMDRDSTDTQFNFDNAGPGELFPTASPSPSGNTAPQSTNKSRPAVPKKDIADGLVRKRKRGSKDEGRNEKKNTFQKPLRSKLPKGGVSAKANNGNRPQDNDSVATEAVPGTDALEGPHDVSTSPRPQLQPFLLPLTTKDESPWETFNKEYTVELGGLVAVAERRNPAHGLVVVKEFSGKDAGSKLSILRQIPESIQNRYFVSCLEVFHFQNILYVITECMTISLLHIVAAPRYPRENQVAAIIGQVG